MKFRDKMIKAMKDHAKGHIAKHAMNVEVYFRNAAGIGGEGNADVLEEIEKELDVVARYHDQLEMLDKYFVDETSSKDKFWWGEVNQKISEKIFDKLYSQVISYYNNSKTKAYMFDGFAGAEKEYSLSVRFLV